MAEISTEKQEDVKVKESI